MSDYEFENDDDFNEDELSLGDIEQVDNKQSRSKKRTDARQRLEQLREEMELNRILSYDFDDFDEYLEA